jgi:hypothetical protein
MGPESILFIGDSKAATIYAVATGDEATGDKKAPLNVDKIDAQLASMMGGEAKDINITDMKVNPATGNVFLSVIRGKGDNAAIGIFKVDRSGKITNVSLKDVPAASVELKNAPENARTQSITCMYFAKDKLFVAGLSNEEFASTLRALPFPFQDANKGSGIEIFHGSHGGLETKSPIRTFTVFDVAGQANLMAAYTCTPLVKIPVDDLKVGQKVKGTTIAELGNGNVPLSMAVYQKNGKSFLLLANNKRGVMKIPTDGMDKAQPITSRVPGKAGVSYETVEALKGVEKLDRLNDQLALLLVRNTDGVNLQSVDLP